MQTTLPTYHPHFTGDRIKVVCGATSTEEDCLKGKAYFPSLQIPPPPPVEVAPQTSKKAVIHMQSWQGKSMSVIRLFSVRAGSKVLMKHNYFQCFVFSFETKIKRLFPKAIGTVFKLLQNSFVCQNAASRLFVGVRIQCPITPVLKCL